MPNSNKTGNFRKIKSSIFFFQAYLVLGLKGQSFQALTKRDFCKDENKGDRSTKL